VTLTQLSEYASAAAIRNEANPRGATRQVEAARAGFTTSEIRSSRDSTAEKEYSARAEWINSCVAPHTPRRDESTGAGRIPGLDWTERRPDETAQRRAAADTSSHASCRSALAPRGLSTEAFDRRLVSAAKTRQHRARKLSAYRQRFWKRPTPRQTPDAGDRYSVTRCIVGEKSRAPAPVRSADDADPGGDEAASKSRAWG